MVWEGLAGQPHGTPGYQRYHFRNLDVRPFAGEEAANLCGTRRPVSSDLVAL